MTRYLISISIGPVQEFIAAARKTADLYAGSQLLVGVVGAAGEFSGDERIYPASVEGGGANKILAVVSGDPEKHAENAEQRAKAHLRAVWKETVAVTPLASYICVRRAEAQLESLLEFYAAWTPIEEPGDYSKARRRVEELLSGRKALRDFSPLYQDDEGVPKSPLEPALATVLKLEDGKVPAALQEKYGFKPSEHLDAVSLLKRFYGRTLHNVPSTHDLAHAGASAEAKKNSEFRPSREVGDDPNNKPAYSYFAILLADGDNMGKLLNENEGCEQHKNLSRQLDAFATEARTIVRGCDGFLVYAGGDDVLALLPVTTALACGAQLSEAFTKHLQAFQTADLTPTLSAGIALVHYREPLSTSLERARAAEKKAKAVDGKDAVCIALHTRGGAPLAVAQKWAELGDLQTWQHADLPRGLPYELRELAREWPEGFDAPALKAEAQRIADRKVKQHGSKGSIVISDVESVQTLVTLSEKLILARFLSGKGDRT